MLLYLTLLAIGRPLDSIKDSSNSIFSVFGNIAGIKQWPLGLLKISYNLGSWTSGRNLGCVSYCANLLNYGLKKIDSGKSFSCGWMDKMYG